MAALRRSRSRTTEPATVPRPSTPRTRVRRRSATAGSAPGAPARRSLPCRPGSPRAVPTAGPRPRLPNSPAQLAHLDPSGLAARAPRGGGDLARCPAHRRQRGRHPAARQHAAADRHDQAGDRARHRAPGGARPVGRSPRARSGRQRLHGQGRPREDGHGPRPVHGRDAGRRDREHHHEDARCPRQPRPGRRATLYDLNSIRKNAYVDPGTPHRRSRPTTAWSTSCSTSPQDMAEATSNPEMIKRTRALAAFSSAKEYASIQRAVIAAALPATDDKARQALRERPAVRRVAALENEESDLSSFSEHLRRRRRGQDSSPSTTAARPSRPPTSTRTGSSPARAVWAGRTSARTRTGSTTARPRSSR